MEDSDISPFSSDKEKSDTTVDSEKVLHTYIVVNLLLLLLLLCESTYYWELTQKN